METISRRSILSAAASGGLLTAAASAQTSLPQPQRPGVGGTDPGPRNLVREQQNPDIIVPPSTDHGTLPNLRFSFSDAHMRLETGGWTRQITERELGVSKNIAGVNMRLNAGGVRELHWHKEAEWAYMLYGTARITAIDAQGRNFVDDVGVGDLWYFPPASPIRSRASIRTDANFCSVFDSGGFDEDSTFLLSDWFKHTPNEVLAKNFGVPGRFFGHTPDPSELYIFPAPVPGRSAPTSFRALPVPQSFSHRMLAQIRSKPKAAPSASPIPANFPLPKPSPQHWSKSSPAGCANCIGIRIPMNGNITSKVRHAWACLRLRARRAPSITRPAMSVMCRSPWATTSKIPAPPLRFLEMFKSSYYADLSLNQWLA